MPYHCSRSLPRAVHNWIGMVVGFLSGQIFNWVTHIFVMSLCHAHASISLCNEDKHTVLDLDTGSLSLHVGSAYSNHTELYSQPAAYVHYLFNHFLTHQL